jgi:hypothetical protein
MYLKYLANILIAVLIPFSLAFSQSPLPSDQDCLTCHGKPEISQVMSDGTTRTLYVDPDEWYSDVHCQGKLTCVHCHTYANPLLHFREGFIDVDCARCHPIEAEEYEKNIHLTFTANTITEGKELPLCYHCHTKHNILRHDNPSSSVHESQIGETCGSCHPEIMIGSVLKGSSLGKISGHRKGDISEEFDMTVCIDCHYEDSAHGAKRGYKDFCARCHDVRSKGNIIMGPTHLDAPRWSALNFIENGLLFILILASGTFLLYKSRQRITKKIAAWYKNMKVPAGQKEEIKGNDSESAEEQEPPAGEGDKENDEPE